MAELTLEQALEMYRRMLTIRLFEDRLYELFLQGLVPGTLHQYQGQEAIAVGVCSNLRKEDLVFSTHRPVGHAIAKGVPLEAIAAELWGKSTGCAGGKGGQMHLVDKEAGVPPSNAIVGANIPIATGAALAFKLQSGYHQKNPTVSGLQKRDAVAISFFGDGATNTGAFHEGLNLAAVKSAPVVFVCENNQYAASTHISLNMRIEDIASRARAYGIPGYTLDGMNLREVYSSAKEAIERARSGDGPTLLEYKTYRFMGHSRGDPGGYRSKEEIQSWRERDPLQVWRKELITAYSQGEEPIERVGVEVNAAIDRAIEFAQGSPDPDPDEVLTHVYSEKADAP